MKKYAERYEDATREIVARAAKIEAATPAVYRAQYSLPRIVGALRSIYKDPVLHDKFVGTKFTDNKWSKGFCGLASMSIYNLYGGDDVWQMMAVRITDWEHGPVIFLKHRATGLNFGTTGEHFYPMTIPYDVGKPLDVSRLRTPNLNEFMMALRGRMEK